MYRAIFLHVAAIFNDNASPIAAQGCAGSNINLLADDHVTRNYRQRVYKGRFMYNGNKALEFVKHDALFCKDEYD